MTGQEWSTYFESLPKSRRDKIQEALETLAVDKVFEREFSNSFNELAAIIKHPLTKPVTKPEEIKVIETGDRDWFKPGIHLSGIPSPQQLEDAINDAANKGFSAVYVHHVERTQFTKRR